MREGNEIVERVKEIAHGIALKNMSYMFNILGERVGKVIIVYTASRDIKRTYLRLEKEKRVIQKLRYKKYFSENNF